MQNTSSIPNAILPPQIEPCYTVKQIAAAWQVCENTVIALFRNEPGVLNFGTDETRFKRGKAALRIPVSVFERVQKNRRTR